VTASNARPHMSEIDDSPLPRLGRDDELERLYRIVDRVSERGGAYVVRGEAGIGKSALVAAASQRAQTSGVMVLVASGVESEAQLPFAGLHQLLLPSLGLLDRLPDPLRNALEMAFGYAPQGAAPDVFLIGLATLGLISDLATETPVLLVVEDAQWLDRSSARLLAFVGRRLEMVADAIIRGRLERFEWVDRPPVVLANSPASAHCSPTSSKPSGTAHSPIQAWSDPSTT
jgi:hypothetical protein